MKKRRKRAKRGQTKGKKRAAKEEKEGCKRGKRTAKKSTVWWKISSLRSKPCLTQKIRNFLLWKVNKNKEKMVKPVDILRTVGSHKACNYRKFVLDSKRIGCSWARTSAWLDALICKITTHRLAKQRIRSCIVHKLK